MTQPKLLVVVDVAYEKDLVGTFPQRKELRQLLSYIAKFLKVDVVAVPAAREPGLLEAAQYREFLPELMDSIEAVDGITHILLMGKGATYALSAQFPEYLRKRRKWNRVVGRRFEMLNAPAMVTLSPSVLFTDKNAENAGYMQLRTVLEHVHRLVNHSPTPVGDYEFIQEKSDFRAWIRNFKPNNLVGVDLEMTGLNFQRDDILSIQFSTEPFKGVTVPWTVLTPEEWQSTFEFMYKVGTTFTGQNFKFDSKFLMREGLKIRPWWELSVMHVIEDERPGSHNLDGMSLQLLGEEKREVNVDDFAEGNIELFSEYAAVDADLTRRCAMALKPVVERPIFGIMRDAAWTLSRMEYTGWLVDDKLLDGLIAQCQDQLDGYKELFERYSIRDQNDRTAIMKSLNVSGSVDKAMLTIIGGELAEAVIDARGLAKIKKSYLDRIKAGIQFDGRYHADYRLAGPSTGRTSCGSGKVEKGMEWQSINMQNIPRPSQAGDDEEEGGQGAATIRSQLRNLFIADPGNVIVGGDLSAAEFRVAAALCGDPQMIKDCNDGLDTHSVIAIDAFNLPIVPNLADPSTFKALKKAVEAEYESQRTTAKRGTFAALYGGGEASIMANTGASREAAQRIITALYTRYPLLRQFFNDTHTQIRTKGYVGTYYGRVRRFPYASGIFGRTTQEAMLREGQNYRIQSTASDYCLKALANFDREHGDRWRPLAFVHDAFYAQAPQSEADDCKAALSWHLQNADNLNGVIMYADAKSASRWGEL